jgi:tetratricopeptide (TPR) repeat protein
VGEVELHERLFGGGLVGTVSIDSGLSWAQARALESIDAASARMSNQISVVAAELSGVRTSLNSLGWDMATIRHAVHGLESSICVRLDHQAALLTDAVSLLDAMNQTLRSPARTQAAEHISNAGALLAKGRAKRALALANSAIDLDPVNPQGFIAAGWAHVGLREFDAAREAFEEASEAAEGNARCAAARQAARLAYADGESAHALALLEAVEPAAQDDEERRALGYDASIYLAATGAAEAAAERLHSVCMADERFAEMAVVDRAIADHPALLEAVEQILKDWADVRVHHARATVGRASELVALARETRAEVFPTRTWMEFGLSGARFLIRREALIKELDELIDQFSTLSSSALRGASELEVSVAAVQSGEERLTACRAEVQRANREFTEAERGT